MSLYTDLPEKYGFIFSSRQKKKSPENNTHHWEVHGEQDRERNFALLKSFLHQHFKCFVQV